MQMDKLKDDLRAANHKIAFLTEENQKLNDIIDKLKAELNEKQKKASVTSVGMNTRKRKVENGGTCTETFDNRDESIQFDSEVSCQKKIHDLEEKLASVNNNLKLVNTEKIYLKQRYLYFSLFRFKIKMRS